MTRPTVLIGDNDTASARVLRRQTFFGELVPEASGAVLPTMYEEEDYAAAAPGFSSRRLKGDRQWLEGNSARQRRTMSAGGVEGTMSFCPGCGSRYYSGSGFGILSGRLCGMCSARHDRRRAGLEGMGGSKVESGWRRRLKPDTHDDWAGEGGPPVPRAGKGYPPVDERPRPASADSFDGTLNRRRTGFMDRGLRRVTHAGSITSKPASIPARRDARVPADGSDPQQSGNPPDHNNSHKNRARATDIERSSSETVEKRGQKSRGWDRDTAKGKDRKQNRDRDGCGEDTGQRRRERDHSRVKRRSKAQRNRSVERREPSENHSQRPGNQGPGRTMSQQYQLHQQRQGGRASRRQRQGPIDTQILTSRGPQSRDAAQSLQTKLAGDVAEAVVSGAGRRGAARSHKKLSRSIAMHEHSLNSVSSGVNPGSWDKGHMADRDRRLLQRRVERQHRPAKRTHNTTWPQREAW